MYAIVDFHSVGFIPDNWYPPPANDTTLTEFLQFWKTVSSRHADNHDVAFYELFNEPAREVWPYTAADWKELVEQSVTVIRPNVPDKIILGAGCNPPTTSPLPRPIPSRTTTSATPRIPMPIRTT